MTVQAGVDIGSVTTKCVIVRAGAVIGRAVARSGVHGEQAAAQVFEEALRDALLDRGAVQSIVSTGYGRRLFTGATRVITEISAAGRGAWLRTGRKCCLAIDVGGQDTKIVEVSAHGEVTDFLMNNRCAAGTGRFLEIMASVLETDLAGLSLMALSATSPVAINSTCSVFAESEVISLISQAAAKEDIAAGLFNAIGARIAGMFRQFGQSSLPVVFCGGGARSEALKSALEGVLAREVAVLEDPQLVVAYGAATSGLDI